MSGEYIAKEIEKVISNDKFSYPLNFAFAAVMIAANHKAINIKILDVKNQSSLADYYVIASFENYIQGGAIADDIAFLLKSNGAQKISVEGSASEESRWILLDFGPVMVHLFTEDSRENYNLEELFRDSEKVNIPPELFVISNEPKIKKEDISGYF